MPTIDQLAPATAASDTDELIANQSGITRKLTRAQVVSGLQPALSVPSGTLLGRASSGTGTPEALTLGANLSLTAGTLSATTAYVVSALPAGTVPAKSDLVAMSQSGSNTAVPYAQFMSGLPTVPNIDSSQMLVTPAGEGVGQKLADFAASVLPVAGGTMTGALTLVADPATPLEASTKQYVDAQTATSVPKTGGSMTGVLLLAADPATSLQAATKQYVDTQTALALPKAGGTMAGVLTLAADPVAPLQASTKQYVDAQAATALPKAGGTMSGVLTLATDPEASLQAATKQYVDAQVAPALLKTGGVMTGTLSLAADPVLSSQAATKQYVDSQLATSLPLAGGKLSGALTLAADPASSLQAATKQYVDTASASGLPVTGGTLTGVLTLAADPILPLQAATKQYVDAASASALPITGGALTGGLAAPSITTSGNVTVNGTLAPAAVKVAQTGSQTTQSQTQINLQRNGSSPTDGPLMTGTMVVNHTGGGQLACSNMILTSTVNDAVDSNGNFVDGMNSDVYAFISALNVNAVRGSTATLSGSQHVAITGTATKKVPTGGYPAGRTGAEMWGLWLPVTDATNLPSAVSGSVTGIEMDLSANNLDTINHRFGYQFVLGEATQISAGGNPCEWAYGLYYTGGANAYYKFQISAGGNYSVAVLDTRNAFGGKSKITVSLATPSTTISVDPILPFTSAGVYGNPVSSSNTAQIKVGATTYTQVGFTMDGPGKTSGTLTFSTPVSVADGAINNVVVGASRTIWMATGQQIAFDYGGSVNLFYDTTINSMHLSASLQVDSQLVAGGAVTANNVATTNGIVGQGGITAGNGTTGNTLSVNGATSGSPVNLSAGGKDSNIGVTISAAGNGAITLSGGSVTIPNGGLNVNNGTIFSTGGYTGSNIAVTGFVVAYGTGQFGGMLSANAGLTVGGLINLPKYKVAALPAVTEAALAYATDGRKPGEASGAGTGVLVVGSRTSQWISVSSGAVVTV